MDFDVIHFFLPLFFTTVITCATLLFIFLSFKAKFLPDYENIIPIFEVVESLEKLCPIHNSSNNWKLSPFDHGCYRCWSQSLKVPFWKTSINVCGSAAIIGASSGSVCSLISDVSRWPEWNPFFTSQYISKLFHNKDLRRDYYMEAEQVISIVRETNKIQSFVFMYRFQEFSENKVGWILFWNPKMLEFLYFLIQPIKNNVGNTSCLLTHIMGTESKLLASSISLVPQRIRNIQDLISLSSLSTITPTLISSHHPNSKNLVSSNKFHPSKGIIQEDHFFSVISFRARQREKRNTVFLLVPFKSPFYKFWRRDVEFKLAAKSMNSAAPENKLNSHGLEEHLPLNHEKIHKKNFLRRTTSDVGIKLNLLSYLSKDSHTSHPAKNVSLSGNKGMSEHQENFVESNMNDENKNSELKEQTFPRTKLRSFSETAKSKLEKESVPQNLEEIKQENTIKLGDIRENVEDKLLAMDEHSNKEMLSSSIFDFEILENSEFTENRIAAFLTQGNYGAAELQAEALMASQFADGMNSGNFQSVGGWMFHSYNKGLCILTKTTCNNFLKICSFLCQVELPVAPEDVWKFVKNPQFRFICDESVKSVEVLEKISSSQKLILLVFNSSHIP